MARPLILITLGMLTAGPALAQVGPDLCRDRRGRVIPEVVDDRIPWAGVATYLGGQPVILWNARHNRRLSTNEQSFIYLHECGHHALGHLRQYVNNARWELEADCWAIQRMVEGGMVRGHRLALLLEARQGVRGDAFHLGGDAHVRSLWACVQARTSAAAWARALDEFVRASRDGFIRSRGLMLDAAPGPPVYESLVDAPGTYDCEVVGPVTRCPVFAGRKPGPARKRFDRLVRVIRDWLPAGWISIMRPGEEDAGHTFFAHDAATGTLITLVQRGPRLQLLVRRAPILEALVRPVYASSP